MSYQRHAFGIYISIMMKREAVEEVKELTKIVNDRRYSIDNRYLIEKRIKDLVSRFNILYKDIW